MKIYSLLIIFLLNEAFYCQSCKKFVCSQLEGDLCMSDDASNNQFLIQKCSEQSSFCPFMNNKESQISCTSRQGYHPRSFPGGKCESDSECISGSCSEGACAGKGKDEECDKHMECQYGLACKSSNEKKLCQPQSNENEPCEEDFDCINSHGCLEGKCVGYLSLPLGTKVGKSKNLLPLCQSGLDYKGKCDTLTNVGANPVGCDNEPCKYKLQNGKEVTIKEFCMCGKNSRGNKFCRLGNGAPEWNNYLDSLKSLLNDTSNCNTVERGICMSHFKENGEAMQKFMLSSTRVMRYHELAEADDCVLNVFFPEMSKSQRRMLRKRSEDF